MKLLDTYALHCGAKISEPFLYESYFPLPMNKYVTFQAETPFDSRNYAYWQDVLDIINPILIKSNISILQLGVAKEAPYQRIIDLRGKTDYHHLAYLLRRSLLHFGPDSFCVHLASSFDVPIVGLYSCSMPEVAGPNFGNADKQVLFKGYERIGNKKPSCAPQENPKSINAIKPEEIANAIFKLLNIDFATPFQTVYLGSRYSHNVIRELVPNSPHIMPMPEQPIELRADLHFDEKMLAHHMTYWQKCVIVTDKPLPIPMLKHFKSHIVLVAYHIGERDSDTFAKEVSATGIPIALLSRLPEEEIQKKKIRYYEYGVIAKIPDPDPKVLEDLRKQSGELFYRSCKLVAANGQIYGSHSDREANKPLTNDFEYHRVIDSPLFWQDLDFYTLVKKL